MDHEPMAQYLVWAMQRKGVMATQDIYRAVKHCAEATNRPLRGEWESHVRQALQAHCKTRPQWNGRDDFFDFHGRGLWSYKKQAKTIDDLLQCG